MKQIEEIVRQSFSVQAENFESPAMSFSKQEYLQETLKAVGANKTDLALEVAAGTCACGRALADQVQHVVCLDLTPAMLAEGKKEAERQGKTNMTFLLGNAMELPFLPDSFDLVISRLAFHHFPDVRRPMQEMARVLKPGGKLVLIDMEAAEEYLRQTEDEIETLRDASHVKNLSREEMLHLFEEEKIEVEQCTSTKIPVSLDAWMQLTKTPQNVQSEIQKRMREELEGGAKTGFSPYQAGGSIRFDQRWLFLLGRKPRQEKTIDYKSIVGK